MTETAATDSVPAGPAGSAPTGPAPAGAAGSAPTGADLDAMVDDLQSAVWTLALAGHVGLDRARRIRHAAHLLAAAADRLLVDAAGEAAAPAQPGLAGLVSTLVTLDRLAAVDRGRLAPDVMMLARTVLRRERGRAMAETGMSVTDLAREYGISAGAVRTALGDARTALPDGGPGPDGSRPHPSESDGSGLRESGSRGSGTSGSGPRGSGPRGFGSEASDRGGSAESRSAGPERSGS